MSNLHGPYDPRGAANLLLEVAASENLGITNLALQKLLYFAHSLHLIETKGPLITGYFEAWKFGPVHPTVYQSFKSAGDGFINFRATKEDVLTGKRREILLPENPLLRRRVRQVIYSYGQMTAGRLVEISHARGAPWHFIVSKATSSMAFGMRIPDDVIIERFKHHKVALGAEPRHGEPGEDTPIT